WPRRFLLDGQQVMTLFRRSPKPASPLRHRQEELIRREAELRARVEELERMIVDQSLVTHSGSRLMAAGAQKLARLINDSRSQLRRTNVISTKPKKGGGPVRSASKDARAGGF